MLEFMYRVHHIKILLTFPQRIKLDINCTITNVLRGLLFHNKYKSSPREVVQKV